MYTEYVNSVLAVILVSNIYILSSTVALAKFPEDTTVFPCTTAYFNPSLFKTFSMYLISKYRAISVLTDLLFVTTTSKLIPSE